MFLIWSFIIAFIPNAQAENNTDHLTDLLQKDAFRLRWQSLRLNKSIVDLAVNGTDLYALDKDGNLFRKQKNNPFRLVLRADSESIEPDIEEILLDVEFSIEENTDSNETEYSTDYENPDVFTDSEPTIEVIESIEGDINDSIFDPIRSDEASFDAKGIIWSDPVADTLILCRRNSCLFSPNNAKKWKPIDDLIQPSNFYKFNRFNSNLIFASTQNGLWISKDGGKRWKRGSLKGLAVRDVVYDGSLLYAATDKGIYLSQDGRLWNRINNPGFKSFNMIALHADNDTKGTLWATTADEMLRSDDYGQSFTKTGALPKGNVFHIGKFWQTNQLSALSSTGVWLSHDNGIVWHHIKNGLRSSVPIDIDIWGENIVIASISGVFVLAKDDGDAHLKITIDRAELHRLLDATLMGVDQQLNSLEIGSPLLRGLWTPTLRLWGSFDRDLTLIADYGAIAARGQNTGQYNLGLELCFGACSSVASSSISAAQQDSVMVIGSDVYSSEVAGIAPAAANVQYKLHQQRRKLSESVTSLFSVHQQLKAKTATLSNSTLLEQTMHEIEMQEIVSKLDALSLGLYYKNTIQKE